jgi:putative FmdB family regulatory protein
MPIYEYRCENGHTFEVMQSFTDDAIAQCQTCSLPVEKVFHPVAIHFKGKGFYNTDYGTRKRAREAKESDGSTSGEGKSAGSGEGKSADNGGGGNGSSDSGSSDSGSSGSGSSGSGSKTKSDSKTPAASAKSSSD